MSVTISTNAMELLRELTIIPQVVGYDHRIAELDEARLITWVPGEGYSASEAGHELVSLQDRGGVGR